MGHMLPYTTKIIFFKKDDRPGFPTGHISFQTKYNGNRAELRELYKNSAPGKRKCAWSRAEIYDNVKNKQISTYSISGSMSFLDG
jgi:hypothetical protein